MHGFLSHLLLGIFLILLAFFAGAQKNPVFGLFGFLSFFVLGVTLVIEGFRRKESADLKDASQALVYEAGLKMIREIEAAYRGHVVGEGAQPSPLGIFRARLFGLNFAVSAMTLGLGAAGHQKSEEVYQALVKQAASGLLLQPEKVRKISAEILQEQNRALQAEHKNVGSGQYALAALYEAALAESLGKMDSAQASFLGQRVGLSLAGWAELYRKITGRAVQAYTGGFSKSEKDFQGLPEE